MDEAVRRRLLAGLLLWSLVPLPFVGIIQTPFWLAAGGAAAFMMWRPRAKVRLSNLVQNLLAVLILVVVLAVGGRHVGPLRPLGHLLLLVTAVRALTVSDRRSFIRALVPVMLVWIVAVASSTHISLVLYLVASAVVWWWAGMRIHLEGLPDAGFGAGGARLPRLGHVAVAGSLTMLLAVPVFVAVPRLRSPWMAATGGIRTVSGFSEMVELQGWRRIEESQEVAVVVRLADSGRLRERWTRLRGPALDLLLAGTWGPRRTGLEPAPERDGLVWLDPERRDLGGTTRLAAEIRTPARYVFLPYGAVAVRSPVPLLLDPTGALRVEGDERAGLSYTVWVADQPTADRAPPPPRDLRLPVDNPRIGSLAREVVAGAASATERAEAVERFLQTTYGYSLNASAGNHPDPVAWFLFTAGEGHCEFFAGAMAVMLRHLDIPARVVAGFNGGSMDPSGDTLLVRQANAHTWVEAWCGPDLGWRVFDPTPAQSVPPLTRMGAMDRLHAAWESLQATWDRYVLTFGLGEQVGLARSVAAAGRRAASLLASRHTPVALAVLTVLVVLGWALRTRRGRAEGPGELRRGPAARTLARLVRLLERGRVEVPPGATVRAVGRLARERWPAAAGPVGELVWLAERELYGGGEPVSPRAARRLWVRLRRAMQT